MMNDVSIFKKLKHLGELHNDGAFVVLSHWSLIDRLRTIMDIGQSLRDRD